MQIGRPKKTDIRIDMDKLRKEEPEWYDALIPYGDRISRILDIFQLKDPRVIARTLRAEGFIRPAELTEEAMKAYPIYNDYFIHQNT